MEGQELGGDSGLESKQANKQEGRQTGRDAHAAHAPFGAVYSGKCDVLCERTDKFITS